MSEEIELLIVSFLRPFYFILANEQIKLIGALREAMNLHGRPFHTHYVYVKKEIGKRKDFLKTMPVSESQLEDCIRSRVEGVHHCRAVDVSDGCGTFRHVILLF